MYLLFQMYYHGETIHVNVQITNNSNKRVKGMKIKILQIACICLFSQAEYKCPVAAVEERWVSICSRLWTAVCTLSKIISNGVFSWSRNSRNGAKEQWFWSLTEPVRSKYGPEIRTKCTLKLRRNSVTEHGGAYTPECLNANGVLDDSTARQILTMTAVTRDQGFYLLLNAIYIFSLNAFQAFKLIEPYSMIEQSLVYKIDQFTCKSILLHCRLN